jgi:sensor histidine kinase YesM
LAFYKRSVFLINPSFQLKFSLMVCSLIFLSSLIYPLLLWDFFTEIISLHPQLKNNLDSSTNEFLIYLSIVQILFTGLVFILTIFMTHKIAGPLYKLKNHLSSIRQGEPLTPLTFREGDYFQDVAEEISLFLETLSLNQESDFQYVEEVSLYLNNLTNVVPDDKRPILSEISRRLIEIKSRYKNAL